ncbi:MAG: type II toxin-antitoxin system RelE/ParE family toxin [Rhizobiaceae bacterium]|nr:type II toxin-antitoxin system RelE/ParE family toxin [Rhizobiaceae bacterium]
MKIFKSSSFDKFAQREKIGDDRLCEAVARAGKGLLDADLGANVIKQRVAREGAGRSGGYRVLIFFKAQTRAVFVFGFAKSDLGNLGKSELAVIRKAAKLVLAFSEAQMEAEVAAGRMKAVVCDDQGL